MDNWPVERREELEMLEELLYEIRNLNNGSNFIGKIQNCIKIADALTKVDLGLGYTSFLHFLNREALKGE